jgi:DNA-binding sugar fermentation-stimulating protein
MKKKDKQKNKTSNSLALLSSCVKAACTDTNAASKAIIWRLRASKTRDLQRYGY